MNQSAHRNYEQSQLTYSFLPFLFLNFHLDYTPQPRLLEPPFPPHKMKQPNNSASLFYKCPVLLSASSSWVLKEVEYATLGKEYQQAIYRRKLKDTNLREQILFLTQQLGKNKATDITQYLLSCEEQKTLCYVCVIFLEDLWWAVI